jgi:ABC-type antimicrobial peptide transport system permease subunit
VVGVIANAAIWPALGSPRDEWPTVYVPINQFPELTAERTVMVRTKGPSSDAMALVRAEAQAAGGSLPFIEVTSVDALFQPALRPLRMGTAVFAAFGVLALVIASLGLMVVTGYAVTRRQKELGIRLVLGAAPQRLVQEVLMRSLTAVGAGIAAGCAIAYAGSRWLQSQLFEVASDDIRVYAIVAVVLLVSSLVAAFVPARRAGHVDPATTLRTE